jgi:AraC family transcriptional regulator of adaptative response/methylated-DNA-[protein]-cysteine methyltransferase
MTAPAAPAPRPLAANAPAIPGVFAGEPAADYDIVRHAIEFISEEWRDQPSLETIAEAVGLKPLALQRLFTRWAGLSPKGFLQAVTLDHARSLLADSASILDASFEVGLSGPGRLHDLFVTHEAMTPGAFKARGEGLAIRYGFHPSPFGTALVMATEHGLAGLAFADAGGEAAALADMQARWPRATYVADQAATTAYVRRIFDPATWRPDQPLRVVMIGTDFELRVWDTLLKLPLGRATTYSDIASHIGKPSAARAVGTAVGRNPISFVVPCHRVLGKSGNLCGYHWGLTRKRAILGWEAGIAGQG